MKSVSSYHANHYLSVPLLQFKRASISEEETKGKKRKGSQINNDNGLVFFFVFYFLMECLEQVRAGETS